MSGAHTFATNGPLGAQELSERIPKPTDQDVTLILLVPIDPQIDGRNWYGHCEYLLPICTASVFAWTRCLEPALAACSEELLAVLEWLGVAHLRVVMLTARSPGAFVSCDERKWP